MAKILEANDRNLNLCKRILENSKVVAVPTETVYGLAGNALDEIALRTIFEIKGRPLYNPIIIHTDCLNNAEKYAFFNDLARKLIKKFWPGPLTIILPKKEIIPNLVTANLDSVAIRCPNHPTFLKLLNRLRFPLAAPSANPFGYVSPTCSKHVNISLGDRIDYILDGADSEIGIESTIVDLRNPDKPKILRPGPISKELLENISHIEFTDQCTTPKNNLRAPGMLKSHYSPKTPLEIVSYEQLKYLICSCRSSDCAYVLQKKSHDLINFKASNLYWLSKDGSNEEIAYNIYRLLRDIDAINYKNIYIEDIDNSGGFSVALRDRLTKAASQ